MNQYKLKSNHQTFVLYIEIDDWNTFLLECKDKLKTTTSNMTDSLLEPASISQSKQNQFFQLYFQFSEDLNEQQLIELIELCQNNQIIFLGFNNHQDHQQIQVLSKVYAGDYLEISTPVLIMDDIGKDVHIKAYHSIIVNGIIQGTIDLVHSYCTCTSLGFNEGRIRIYDQPYQKLTSFSYSYLYYQDHAMILQKEVN